MKDLQGPAARKRRWVDPMSADDIRRCCRELGCSEWRLLDAVAFVGARIEDVRRHLLANQASAGPGSNAA